MDRDFAGAKSHLTGDFLDYYDKFTKEIVTPTVQQKHLGADRHSGSERPYPNCTRFGRRAGVPQRDHDEQGQAQPLITPSSVRITLTKVNGSWLISKLDPSA